MADEKDEAFDATYHRGPVILRGPMIPSDTTTGNLLAPEADTEAKGEPETAPFFCS